MTKSGIFCPGLYPKEACEPSDRADWHTEYADMPSRVGRWYPVVGWYMSGCGTVVRVRVHCHTAFPLYDHCRTLFDHCRTLFDPCRTLFDHCRTLFWAILPCFWAIFRVFRVLSGFRCLPDRTGPDWPEAPTERRHFGQKNTKIHENMSKMSLSEVLDLSVTF